MAKDKLTDYDSTAANNLDVGGISVAEGMLPSGVNNAIREQMSHLADFAAGTSGVDVLKLQDDTDTNSIKLQAPSSVTTTTTFTLPDGDGASGQTMITDGAGTLSWAAPYGNRNLIINGAMQVAQRGTSHSTSGYGSLDRWALALSGATATLSQESFTLGQTDVVGADYYAKVDVTTGNNNCGLYYKVEAQDVIKAGGQEVTLSYWAKGTSPTDGLRVGLVLVATGGPVTGDNTVTLTGTWTKYTHTFTMPSFSGVTLDASSYLEIHWDQDAGDTGTAAWELNIAQVQLEVGETATPFEHRSYGDELARCQRYYQKHGNETTTYRYLATGYCNSTSQAQGVLTLPVTMRSAPTASVSGSWQILHSSTSSSVTLGTKQLNESSIGLEPSGSGFTQNSGIIIRDNNDATAQVKLDAEL